MNDFEMFNTRDISWISFEFNSL